MTKKDIVLSELYKLIKEIVDNKALDTPITEATLRAAATELEKLAIRLIEKDPEEVFVEIIDEYHEAVDAEALLSPGIATIIQDSKECIYLPVYKGNIGFDTHTHISQDTRFDLASITKLFTVLEALKLNQDGLFDINQMVDEYDASYFKKLHVTVADLLRFKYELQTKGRLDEANITSQQFFRRLFRPQIGPNTHIYSDIPFIIAKMLMANNEMKFFSDYLGELGLLSVGYDTNGTITGGYDHRVADPKARLLQDYSITPGHAGLFGTADDLIKVFDGLNNGFLTQESLDMLLSPGTTERYAPTYDKEGRQTGQKPIVRGMGVYIEHPDGLRVGEVIPGSSKRAFAITGYTGGYAGYDLQNGFASVILANPISIEATAAKVLVSRVPEGNKTLLDKNGVPFEEGTTIVSNYVDGKKNITVLSPEGFELEVKRPYTNLMNGIKMAQFYTLLKLRLTKRVAKALAKSDLMVEHIDEMYSGGKDFGRGR